jgi:hypothetical protein
MPSDMGSSRREDFKVAVAIVCLDLVLVMDNLAGQQLSS